MTRESPTISEPRTAAGRQFVAGMERPEWHERRDDVRAAVLAIEAEAAQPIDVERLARALTSRWRMVKAAGPRNGPTPLELARAIRSEYARLSEEEG